MPRVREYPNFRGFRDDYIVGAKMRSSAFHASLFPRPYPTDLRGLQKLQEAGRPPSDLARGEYTDFVSAAVRRGVHISSLLVMYTLDHPLYDADHIARTIEVYGPIQEAGEYVRVAEYSGKLLAAMASQCGEDSSYVQGYLRGVEVTGDSQNSFWSLRNPQDDVRAIWTIGYKDGDLCGGPVHEPPFDADLERYEAFWHFVAQPDSGLSVPL